ncbi:uncharacterized protein LOC124270375 [Haliotis rubra]|uniref:uncharacterized protein LOC124270375 n=1 Tax=Haliotis rubra TaxID=36100 RepID=UPI001EE553FC|nr:uncharacterized protein LOC124270375 [Haliotis rubra]
MPRYGKRKDSAIRTLVAETLVLAKTHGYVEKIENELEEELRRDQKEPPKQIVARWRRDGERILKSKYMLLTVVLFCVTDCALVLGELILDLHKVKDSLERSEGKISEFVRELQKQYPDTIAEEENNDHIFEKLLQSNIYWNERILNISSYSTPAYVPRNVTRVRRESARGSYTVHTNSSGWPRTKNKEHSPNLSEHRVEDDIAHAFHLASITILALLVFETFLKAICVGTPFCHRKLEVFDAFIVIVSFVVDLVFLNRLPNYKIQDFVFILAFLLPWRVIRVVNSLVVAVKDHEHFRLKLVYSRKKKIQNSLRDTEIKLQIFRSQCNALRKLCITEGVDEWRVEQLLRIDEYVVNKAGKSKCKIKIDNASVILLDDRRDFPRLSPRPSLSNLSEARLRGSLVPTIEEEDSLSPDKSEIEEIKECKEKKEKPGKEMNGIGTSDGKSSV